MTLVWYKLRKYFPTQYQLYKVNVSFKKKNLSFKIKADFLPSDYHINNNATGKEKTKPLGKPDPSGGTDIAGSQQTYTMNLQDHSSLKGLSFLETHKTLFYLLLFSI